MDHTGNKETKTKLSYPGLDVLRIICAVLVVAIHFAPFGSDEKFELLNFRTVQYFSRNAVPLFFIMSSFFFFKKVIEDDELNMKAAWTKLLTYFKQYVLWTVIYLFMIVKNYTHGRKTIPELIRDFFFCGSYFHLWYLPALITGLIVVVLLYKAGLSAYKILAVSAVLYVIGLFGQSYYNVLSPLRESSATFANISDLYFKIFDTTRNGLFEGTLFASLGLILSNNEGRKESRIKYAVITAVLFILAVAEIEFVRVIGLAKEADFYAITPFITYFIFKLFSSYSCDKTDDDVYAKKSFFIRKISMLVYFIQIYVGMFIKDGINFVTKSDKGNNFLFIPVLVVSFAIAYVIAFAEYKITISKKQRMEKSES